MLQTHVARLNRRLFKVEEHFVSFHIALANQQNIQRWYLLEGMLSHSWQIWCAFCRGVFIESCLGAQTVGGLITKPTVDWTSAERVTYVATCYAKNNPPKAGKTTGSFRHEFTWGDVNTLTTAVSAMMPGNHSSLLSGFGLSVKGANHMQAVRNACAHLNLETLISVKKLSIYYRGTGLRNPSDLMRWNDAAVGYPAFLSWLEDLRVMANLAVQ